MDNQDPMIQELTAKAEATKAQAEALWVELMASEKEMEPFKVRHDEIRSRWAQAYETNRVLTRLISLRTTELEAK